MNSAPPDPLIGRTLDGRYVVRSRIARGGMATVYLGNDLRLQRRVAIKVMHQHLVDDENFTRRFEQEARSAAMLGNANVVGVFDQGIDGGLPYLVMEYLPGITLRELLKQQRQLTAEQALEIGEAVLAGLAAAHRAGIVHRDVKPENVLLADDGRIKVGDFGLARAASANTTTGQALLGTIAYLSPELVTRGVADARSDIYAFGVMLFELLAGEQPFRGEQAMQIAYQHAHSEVPAPSTLNPEVSPELDELVRWCTQRDPEQRPNDAGEALEQLRRIRSGAPLGATRVLPMTGVVGNVTPDTTVLTGAEQHVLAGARPADPPVPGQGPTGTALPGSAVERAAHSGAKRSRRGRWLAAAAALLIALTGGVGWWWGQGPGSLVAVPDLAGEEPAAATAVLESLSLTVERTKCSSLEVAKGLSTGTTPGAGTRIERGSLVELCVSSGPRMLPVPQLNGLGLDAAKEEIVAARFVVGKVLEQRFDGGERDSVILAVGENGKGLGKRYPEQGRIDLITSAGSLPPVAGDTVEEATKSLEDLGLTVKRSLNVEEYHDDLEAGRVIDIVTRGKNVKTGSRVGLRISRGPQLFEVPDVSGMTLKKAIEALDDAGFEPWTEFDVEKWWNRAKATETDPAAGEQVPKGARIQVKFSFFG